MEPDDVFDSREYDHDNSVGSSTSNYEDKNDYMFDNKYLNLAFKCLMWFCGICMAFVVVVMCLMMVALCFQILIGMWTHMTYHSTTFTPIYR